MRKRNYELDADPWWRGYQDAACGLPQRDSSDAYLDGYAGGCPDWRMMHP